MTNSERRTVWVLGIVGLLGVSMLLAVSAAGVMWASRALGLQSSPAASAPSPISEMVKSLAPAANETISDAGVSRDAAPASSPATGSQARGVLVTDLTELYSAVNPGVVNINVKTVAQNRITGQSLIPQRGQGSGFVYDQSHIVTNNHVAGLSDEVEIVFFDGERRAGKVVAVDGYSDLAVIEVTDMPSNVHALPLENDFSSVKPGQPVVAIGNPFGNHNSISAGIVSALGRTVESFNTRYSIPETIQTDAAINPGNSGGPLLNLDGEVIGVNEQIETMNRAGAGTASNSGVGFAIPSTIVARVVPDLLTKGSADWAYLGVTSSKDGITLEMAKANNLSSTRGAYILEVLPDGPSAAALRGAANLRTTSATTDQGNGEQGDGSQGNDEDPGSNGFIIPIPGGPGGQFQIPIPGNPGRGGQLPQEADVIPVGGDVITAINGQPIADMDDLISFIALRTKPGDSVRLTVLRDGQTIEVPVTVKARPNVEGSATNR